MVEQIVYGNISQEYLPLLEKDNIFTKYKNEFVIKNYPNYLETAEEINKIISIQKNAMESMDWSSIKEFSLMWDEDLILAFEYSLKMLKIPTNKEYLEYIYNTSEEIGALIMQLKNDFQRARPYQIAYYTNANLHPFESISGHSPSYPSGHSCQSYFLCSLIASHYPSKEKELMDLATKIGQSRIILGLHYPSDHTFGCYIAKELMQKEDIRKEYFAYDEEDKNV